jgi:hypothetical protein
MKHELFIKWDRLGRRQEVLCDLTESLMTFFSEHWTVLPTPIILDNDLIDLLLVNKEGTLSAVKIFDDENTEELLGEVLRDYYGLDAKLYKLQRAFPATTINAQQKLQLKLFSPHFDKNIIKALAAVTIPLEVYTYSFVKSAEQSGIVLEKIPLRDQHYGNQDYSSILKVLGENVRSETSEFIAPLAAQKETLEPLTHDAAPQIAVPPVSGPHAKNERENDRVLFLDRAKLGEEELIAFFDFDKKLNEFLQKQNSNGKTDSQGVTHN